jgi:dTDP-glucose 4,6-dehydratase
MSCGFGMHPLVTNPLATDLDHVLAHTEPVWDDLRGHRIFVTGGTGFIGCWLLETFVWANDKLGLGASALVLTRNPEAFRRKAPHLASHPAIEFHCGDIRSFAMPPGVFSHVIHAAQEYSDSLELFTNTIEGTRRTLEFALRADTNRYLYVSSGAVYGSQPHGLEHVPETYLGAPETMLTRSAYGEAKRASEWLCAAFHEKHGLATTIARGFAFVGPYLVSPTAAIANFIRDALHGGPIRINEDGTPYRSYLYAADLAVWLWIILLRGKPCHPYNVGSDRALTIAAVARTVADALDPGIGITIARQHQPGKRAERYVPSIDRARIELGLEPWVDLDEGVRRTAAWCKGQRS